MEKSICCFIDILGYKDIICNSKEEEHKENIIKLKKIFDDFKELNNGYEEEHRGIKVRTFSDNIYIEIKLRERNPFSKGIANEARIGQILDTLNYFQSEMFLMYGLFIRGAVVYGEVYSDDNIIYGKGIIDAVESEKKAKFPRIIVSEELKHIIDENRASYGKEYWGDKILIKLDNYPEYFLNYLECREFSYEEVILEHKELIELNLEKYKDNENVLEKYRWAKDYHNYYIENFGVSNPNYEDDVRDFNREDLLIK